MTATHVCLTVSVWLYTFQIPCYGLLATTARGCEILAGSCGKFFDYTTFTIKPTAWMISCKSNRHHRYNNNKNITILFINIYKVKDYYDIKIYSIY